VTAAQVGSVLTVPASSVLDLVRYDPTEAGLLSAVGDRRWTQHEDICIQVATSPRFDGGDRGVWESKQYPRWGVADLRWQP